MVVILSAVFVIQSALILLIAALVHKTSVEGIRALDKAHERTTRYTEGLVDRIMSADFGEFKSYHLAEKAAMQADYGGEPEDEEEYERIPNIESPDRGGFGSRLGLRALGVREEQAYDQFDEETA